MFRFFINQYIGLPPAVPTSICVTATCGLARSDDFVPFLNMLAVQLFTHLPAIFAYELLVIAGDMLVDITADPFQSNTETLLFVVDVAISWNRLFVFPLSARARLSTPTDGTYHIVYSRYTAPVFEITFATLYERTSAGLATVAVVVGM
jgi:hypothetical protein